MARKRDPIARLREICLAYPEAVEKPFGGHTMPAFRVRDRMFAMTTDGGDGSEVSLWCKAPPGAQEVLVGSDPKRFFVPPYVGHKGWIAVRLDVPPLDWPIIETIIDDSYRMTAPKRLVALLPGGG